MHPRPADFSVFHDQPLSPKETYWLKEGPQSLIDNKMARAVQTATGASRPERLYQILDFFRDHFTYDEWVNEQIFKRTAAEIFKDGTLGGCSDYALVQATLFKIVGIPSRLLLTANVDWLKKYRHNPLAIATGHVFVEVYLENAWHLVDGPYWQLFSNIQPTEIYYPHRGLFCTRGVDYWSLNLRSVKQLPMFLAKCSISSATEEYKLPDYMVSEL